MTSNIKNKHIISIHAPVKGATMYIKLFLSNIHISIHAPVKGATFLDRY